MAVYALVIEQSQTDARYQLSEDEWDALWAKAMEIEKRAGAKFLIVCDSRWSDEATHNWGVVEYPDLNAYQKRVAELEELGWWRYHNFKTILGTKWPDFPGNLPT